MAHDPDSRTAPDDDATNQGVSTQEPAEGGDDSPSRTEGSPEG